MEEGGVIEGDPTRPRWIIDPLDGTRTFCTASRISPSPSPRRNPRWMARPAGDGWGDVIAGLVYQPITDESFWAEKARGAGCMIAVCACRAAVIWTKA
jgi:myo-inositol-1(or 4)-monophosphatase